MSDPNLVNGELNPKDPYEINILEPGAISFSRSQGGVFQGVVEGQVYEELILFVYFHSNIPRSIFQFVTPRVRRSESFVTLISSMKKVAWKWTQSSGCGIFFRL